MATFQDELLISEGPLTITAQNGKVIGKVNKAIIYNGNYVVGDYDDKCTEALKAYRACVLQLLVDLEQETIKGAGKKDAK